jgi:hypothetical protein
VQRRCVCLSLCHGIAIGGGRHFINNLNHHYLLNFQTIFKPFALHGMGICGEGYLVTKK